MACCGHPCWPEFSGAGVSVLALMPAVASADTVAAVAGAFGEVFVVDDHAPFRAAARAVLESAGFRVVGEAATGAEALSGVPATGAGVVLLDVGLPDIDGFSVCAALRRAVPELVVVLCSVHDADQFGDAVARSDAAGFVPKAELSAAMLARLVADQVERR